MNRHLEYLTNQEGYAHGFRVSWDRANLLDTPDYQYSEGLRQFIEIKDWCLETFQLYDFRAYESVGWGTSYFYFHEENHAALFKLTWS